MNDLLKILSDAHEYNELPVRHNEDILNGELSKSCKIQVDPLTLDSSHTKTFLLLQAHFSQLQLPCSDYLTDLKSVLDQSIRVLQAIIDVCAESDWLAPTLYAQQIMQMVIQGRWVDDSPLLTLPFIETHHLYLFNSMSKSCNMPCTFPAGLKLACLNNYERLAVHLREEFDDQQIQQIHKVICDWPTLFVKLTIRGIWENSEEEQYMSIDQPPSKDNWLKVHAGQNYCLMVDMLRKGGKTRSIYCPRFPKGKDESWFLTLGSIEEKGIYSLKRASVKGPKSSQDVNFTVPYDLGRKILTLYIMSDCYLGLDQQYNIHLEVIKAPNLQNDKYN